MSLQTRNLLTVSALLLASLVLTVAGLTLASRRALLADIRNEGLLVAALLGEIAGFTEQVPRDVEAVIGDQMVVAATLAAHLVAVGEQSGLTAPEIRERLERIVARTELDEIWITDRRGHAYLTTEESVDFTFSPDSAEQPQASQFWPLLTGERSVVVQEAQLREIDDQVFKYAGVTGVDHPRIVEVGYNARMLDEIRQRIGLPRLTETLVASGLLEAVRVVGPGLRPIAERARPGLETLVRTPANDSLLLATLRGGETRIELEDDALKLAAPVRGANDAVAGALLLYLPVAHLEGQLRRSLLTGLAVGVVVLALGLVATLVLSRRITRPIETLTVAASALEQGRYGEHGLARTAGRDDEIGRLAHAFQSMAERVQDREAQLERSEQHFRALIENASDVVWIAGRDGEIRYASPASARLLGHPPEALLGRPMRELVHPGDDAAVRGALALWTDGDGSGSPMQLRLRGPDGGWIDTEAVADNLLHEPAVEGVVITLRDVRERKQAEDARREMQLGRKIQSDFLPDVLPEVPGWEIVARFEPAQAVSGDFYDTFLLPGERLCVAVADVSGKGVGAALFMALVRSLLRAFAEPAEGEARSDPLLAVRKVNDYIGRNHQSKVVMFCTVFFGVIDTRAGTLEYVNAGHCPGVVVGADGRVKALLEPTGPAVGVIEGVEFATGRAALAPGDVLLVYTDGVSEAQDPGGACYTDERLLDQLGAPAATAGELLARVEDDVRRFEDGAAPFDDFTMVAVRREEG